MKKLFGLLKIKSLKSKKLFLGIFLLIFLILVSIPAFYFFNQYQKTQKLLNSSNELNAKEVTDIISKVGNLIELPSGTPTVATVSDITKLKSQPFFAKAQNGDKVLIYSDAKKAIIWRPSTNKVVEYANISLSAENGGTSSGTASASLSPTQAPKVKVAIYNGTTTVGLTKTTQDKLENKIEGIEVVARENASKSDYTSTIVVDFSGKNSALVNSIAKELGASVGSMPNGESRTKDAEIIIILGESSSQ